MIGMDLGVGSSSQPLQLLPLSKPKQSPSQLQASHLQNFSLLPFSPLNNFAPADTGLYLLHLLVNCCNHVASGSVDVANLYLEHISVLVDSTGDPVQRLASHFAEALAHRLLKSSFLGLYHALHATRSPPVSDSLNARRCFFDLVPLPKVAAMITNRAIVKAMEEEKVVHVVDLNAWDPSPWVMLMRMLSIRDGGPPRLRITGVHDQKEVLVQVVARLSKEAELLNVPFQFNPVLTRRGCLKLESLNVRAGEALVVCSMCSLHNVLVYDDDIGSVSSPTHLRSFESASSKLLTALRSLSPKIIVAVEKEFDCNSTALSERFAEAMTYYAGLFDSLELALPRESKERAAIEKSLFGLEIRNIIACEGSERKERHEKIEKWVPRLQEAGFSKVPLCYDGLSEAKKLMGGGIRSWEWCRVTEQDGCIVLCWQTLPLFSVSAWKCKNHG